MGKHEFNVNLCGKYYWELMFDIDNTTNSGSIKREVQVECEISMSYEDMVRSLDSKTIAASMGFHAGGIFKILDIGVKGELNTEVKSEYEKMAKNQSTFRKKTTKTDTYEVGPKSSLRLYRLIFNGPGVSYATDTLSTSEKAMDDVIIEVKGKLLPVLKDIEVVYTKDSVSRPDDLIQEARGLNADINSGYGGDFVWLKPIWTDDVTKAVTSIEFVKQKEANSEYKDLAKGAGGDYRYLKLLRDPQSKARITEAGLWRQLNKTEGPRYPPKETYQFVTKDLNMDREGDYLFVCWNASYLK